MGFRLPIVLAALVALHTALQPCPAAAAEFTFDASEFERKPFEIGGHLEARGEHLALNPDGAFYLLAYPPGARRATIDRAAALIELAGKASAGASSLRARVQGEALRDQFVSSATGRVLEAAASWQPAQGAVLEAGKVALKWGTGYAFNPVGFVQRPKDPSDPELSREGYGMALADLVWSFDGALKTLALTPVVVPVRDGINDDFGASGHTNPAVKLYALLHDTDVDLMYAAQGSRPARFGIDFSRNLASNLEVHGEWARVRDFVQPVLEADGRVTQRRFDATSWLVGARYLTERETTWIVELYRNGAGYSEEELARFFDAVHARESLGGNPPADDPFYERLAAAAQGGYVRPNPGRHYLYVRASQKDPFDVLYVVPALTVIANTEDRSASVAAEVAYTGIDGLELRLRYTRLVGDEGTDFGERPNRYRIELRARYFF
jgi:hypothetical protein